MISAIIGCQLFLVAVVGSSLKRRPQWVIDDGGIQVALQMDILRTYRISVVCRTFFCTALLASIAVLALLQGSVE